jgi:hypothetical protein
MANFRNSFILDDVKEATSALALLTMDSAGQRELLIGVLLERIREM